MPRLIEGSVGRPFSLALIVLVIRLHVHVLVHINYYPTTSIVSCILEIRHLYHHIYSKQMVEFFSLGLTLLIPAYAPSIRLLLLLLVL